MTNVHIVILGLLHKKPLHGYEIKHIIEEHMNDWTDIKFGSIYFALSKLKEQSKVEIIAQEQSEGKPARKVYRITDTGREAYLVMLRKLWTQQSRTMFGLDIALFFMDSLPKEEVLAYLRGKIEACEQVLAHMDKHKQAHEEAAEIPRQGMYIMDHTTMHMHAELEWLRSVTEDMEKQD